MTDEKNSTLLELYFYMDTVRDLATTLGITVNVPWLVIRTPEGSFTLEIPSEHFGSLMRDFSGTFIPQLSATMRKNGTIRVR